MVIPENTHCSFRITELQILIILTYAVFKHINYMKIPFLGYDNNFYLSFSEIILMLEYF